MREGWKEVVVNGKEWKFLVTDRDRVANEHYAWCSANKKPFLRITPINKTKVSILIDFFPTEFDLKEEVLQELQNLIKHFTLKSSKIHEEDMYLGGCSENHVYLQVAPEILDEALVGVASVALDDGNWTKILIKKIAHKWYNLDKK